MIQHRRRPMIAAVLLAWAVTNCPAEAVEPSPAQCEEMAERLFGHSAVASPRDQPAPKKIRHVTPKLPQRPLGRMEVRWLGEALVGPDGDVRAVWTARGPESKLAPDIEAAFLTAIRQWKYAPTVVAGVPVPLCLVVSADIHLK